MRLRKTEDWNRYFASLDTIIRGPDGAFEIDERISIGILINCREGLGNRLCPARRVERKGHLVSIDGRISVPIFPFEAETNVPEMYP